jgi:hypothetical protein
MVARGEHKDGEVLTGEPRVPNKSLESSKRLRVLQPYTELGNVSETKNLDSADIY